LTALNMARNGTKAAIISAPAMKRATTGALNSLR
jgi:hypothetical protein